MKEEKGVFLYDDDLTRTAGVSGNQGAAGCASLNTPNENC